MIDRHNVLVYGGTKNYHGYEKQYPPACLRCVISHCSSEYLGMSEQGDLFDDFTYITAVFLCARNCMDQDADHSLGVFRYYENLFIRPDIGCGNDYCGENDASGVSAPRSLEEHWFNNTCTISNIFE